MPLLPVALAFIAELFKQVSPDVQKIIVGWVRQHREKLDLEAPGWAKEIEDVAHSGDDDAATDLANRLRERTQ